MTRITEIGILGVVNRERRHTYWQQGTSLTTMATKWFQCDTFLWLVSENLGTWSNQISWFYLATRLDLFWWMTIACIMLFVWRVVNPFRTGFASRIVIRLVEVLRKSPGGRNPFLPSLSKSRLIGTKVFGFIHVLCGREECSWIKFYDAGGWLT